MLSRYICRRCKETVGRSREHPQEIILGGDWTEADSDGWASGGIVLCPHELTVVRNIHSPPPKACPYFLEHVLEDKRSTCLR